MQPGYIHFLKTEAVKIWGNFLKKNNANLEIQIWGGNEIQSVCFSIQEALG